MRNEHVDFNYKSRDDNLEEICLAVSQSTNKAVVDSAATKTCAGISWFENHKETMDEEDKRNLVTRKDKRSFRFGNSV